MLGIDPKAARAAWTYATVVLLLYALYLIRKTLLLFVLALMFAYLLYPLIDAIDRKFNLKSRIPAVAFPFILIFGSLTVFGVSIRHQVASETAQLATQIKNPEFKKHLAEWTPLGIPVGREIAENASLSQVLTVMPQLGRGVRAAGRDLANLFIVPILSFFLLKDGQRIRDSLMEMFFGGDKSTAIACNRRRAAESVLKDAHTLILQYMRALLFLCLATLVAFTIALRLTHVPYAILLALVAFPLEFVPLVGPLTSAAVILGACEFNGYPHLLRVVAFLGIYRIFQDYVLSPHLMRKGVKLHPLLVLFGVFAGGELGGVGGIFLSVPILALMRLVYYELRKRRVSSADLAEAGPRGFPPDFQAVPMGAPPLAFRANPEP
jgi:predicted PurR-regulated permease PerM